jgi:hypothetical protein
MDLHARPGWTDAAIKRFLGAPDELKKLLGRKYPAHLYHLARVEAVEQTPEWLAWKGQCEQRRQAARDVCSRVAQDLVKSLAEWTPRVREMPLREAHQKAVSAYNDRRMELEDYDSCADLTPSPFLDRITVNYLRHECSDYEHRLHDIAGKIGVKLAYPMVKRRVLEEVARLYPDLAIEARSQAVSVE